VNEIQKMFIERTDHQIADELLLSTAQEAMERRLDEKAQQGCHGWHGPECTNGELLEMLKRNVEKGEMVDVMNLAAMIYARERLYGTET